MRKTTYALALCAATATTILLSGCFLDSDSSGGIADCDSSADLVLAATESCVWSPSGLQPNTDPLTLSCTGAGLVHQASTNYNPADVAFVGMSIDTTNTVFRDVRCSNHPNQ